jgi:hypothetical protein
MNVLLNRVMIDIINLDISLKQEFFECAKKCFWVIEKSEHSYLKPTNIAPFIYLQVIFASWQKHITQFSLMQP